MAFFPYAPRLPEQRSAAGAPGGRVSFRLPAAETAAAEARRRTRRQLSEWRAPAHASENAQLIISELVTNALRHTDSETVGCELRITGSLLRVAVDGAGRGPEARPARAGAEDEGGRGLLLVHALARGWGVRPGTAGGHVVWAELPLAGPSGGAPGA
ncbi:ATP-binding protein [Streptomyces sp. DSM 44917]|uniref:ATP-binding protein n=1 Tax=Streptomyces boetiae TaxID=3075541 RepID=A0ABU2LAW1_9ACTN|nr:ATP-binding protein [Streptomyces sp. DSM 44917]MDT0308704.1 ATP-binding protein [Streptomyces sp. DSM 44917]